MENKINISELLKNCPIGMELDCMMYDRVTFEEVVTVRGFDDKERVKIILSTHYSDGTKDTINLTKFGTYTDDENAKCVIFPKGKTTWKGFHIPFVEGDIVSTEYGKFIGIVKSTEDSHNCYVFCAMNDEGDFFIDKELLFSRFATEDEKTKLFDAIKANGYRWNAYTMTLEKLIKPLFKVGDKIKHIKTSNIYEIIKILSNYYIAKYLGSDIMISFNDHDEYVLVPNKFDINNLKPFDKVLVRDYDNKVWKTQFFERLNNRLKDKFICMGGNRYHQCIPYEGNENLLNYSNKPRDFYINWE